MNYLPLPPPHPKRRRKKKKKSVPFLFIAWCSNLTPKKVKLKIFWSPFISTTVFWSTLHLGQAFICPGVTFLSHQQLAWMVGGVDSILQNALTSYWEQARHFAGLRLAFGIPACVCGSTGGGGGLGGLCQQDRLRNPALVVFRCVWLPADVGTVGHVILTMRTTNKCQSTCFVGLQGQSKQLWR